MINRKRNIVSGLMKYFITWFWMAGVLIIGAGENSILPDTSTADLKTTITYVGNQGILIENGDMKVLIDGLHREYKPAYQHLSDNQLEDAVKGKPPFDNIDVILVSHIHRDHFHAETVGKYLQQNDGTVLIGSSQMADSLKEQFVDYSKISSRVRSVTPSPGSREPISAGGIEIEVMGLRHTNSRFDWVENLGFLVKLGDERILHVGDASMSPEQFSMLEISTSDVDIACLPFWFFIYGSGQQVIRDEIQPARLIALHIDPRESDNYAARVREAFPDAVPFIELFETYPLKP